MWKQLKKKGTKIKMIEIIMCGILLTCTCQDIRKKSVTVRWLWVCGGILALALTIGNAWNMRTILGGTAIGVFVLILGRITGGIGAADGILLCMTGCCLGAMQNAVLFFTALLFAAVVSLFFLIGMKKPKNYELPFLPFLSAAYFIQMWIQM